MENPISIQFLMVVNKLVEGYADVLVEHFVNAESIVLLSNEGLLKNYPIENRESESAFESVSLYVDLLFTSMKELENEHYLLKEPKGIFLETECGELVKVNHLIEHSIVEVAEHTDFDTVFYNTTTLEPLEEE